jgi:hypothetical protein
MNLTLPKYGDALTLFTSQRKEGDPPPRKTARLDPTASGSGRTSTSTSTHGGPIRLTLKNGPSEYSIIILSNLRFTKHLVSTEPPTSYSQTLLGRLANCVRVTLPTSTSGTDSMSISEAYASCRVLVRTMDMGEDVYRILTQQLEQYLMKLLGELKPSTALPMAWLDILATEWKLFDNRLVSIHNLNLADESRPYDLTIRHRELCNACYRTSTNFMCLLARSLLPSSKYTKILVPWSPILAAVHLYRSPQRIGPSGIRKIITGSNNLRPGSSWPYRMAHPRTPQSVSR